MGEGANDRSHISGHDEASDGIFTNFIDLRQVIVTDKTIQMLLDLLHTQEVISHASSKTLEKMGQCIASAVAFLEDVNQFRDILVYVQSQQEDIPINIMKTYLQMIVLVIDAKPLDVQNAREN